MGQGSGTKRTVVTAAGWAAAAAGGWTLGAVLGAAGRVRHGKPLHPRGGVYSGTLTVHGGRRWAVPALDEPRETLCLVRESRAMGLPAPLPDIHGIALRVELPEGPADLLFATTGVGRLGRYVLQLRRHERHPMTTLMPLRTAAGALQLRLDPAGPQEWRVSGASPADRRWEPVGQLVREARPVAPDPDPPIRFDPVRNIPDGTSTYRWIRLLRDPAYVLARRWSPAATWRA